MKYCKEWLGIVLIAVLFVASMYFANTYATKIEALIEGYIITGMVLYVVVGIIATVAAPVSTLPILPIAVTMWGPFVTALLSILSWTIGAVIAFWIARTYGRPLLTRLFDLQKIESLQKRVGSETTFMGVVLLRIIIPVDVLSYAFGFFLPMKYSTYTAATAIGVTPFAFIFAYASMVTKEVLFAIIAVAVILFVIVYLRTRGSMTKQS